MALIYASTRLCDIVVQSVEVVPVLNRFGIYLGTGDRTVAEAAAERGLDTGFMLAILNTFVNEEYFPENTFRAYCADTVAYMSEAHRYYEEYHFPNIRRHLSLLMKASAPDTNLHLMMDFFSSLSADIIARHRADMSTWIPVLTGEAAAAPGCEVDSSAAIDDRMDDLKLMYVKHLSGRTDPNLCYAVLTAITNLERDLRQNNRIRDRILIPLYRRLLHS